MPLCSSALAGFGAGFGASAFWGAGLAGANVPKSTVARNFIQREFRFVSLTCPQRFEDAARLIVLNDAAAFLHVLDISFRNAALSGHLLASQFLACALQ